MLLMNDAESSSLPNTVSPECNQLERGVLVLGYSSFHSKGFSVANDTLIVIGALIARFGTEGEKNKSGMPEWLMRPLFY